MKRTLLFAVAWLLVTSGAFATDTELPSYTLYYSGVDVSQVLDIYSKMTGLELEMDPRGYPQASIQLQTEHPLTKSETIKLLEKTLKEQAGIVITRLDDKRASVTFDASLRIAPVRQKEPPQVEKFILTAKDVNPKSVRLITGPDVLTPNLVFKFVGKTSDEIKAIGKKQPWVQIEKDGVVVAETGWVTMYGKGPTNYIGLDLIFDDYDKAKLAEKTLRGN